MLKHKIAHLLRFSGGVHDGLRRVVRMVEGRNRVESRWSEDLGVVS